MAAPGITLASMIFFSAAAWSLLPQVSKTALEGNLTWLLMQNFLGFTSVVLERVFNGLAPFSFGMISTFLALEEYWFFFCCFLGFCAIVLDCLAKAFSSFGGCFLLLTTVDQLSSCVVTGSVVSVDEEFNVLCDCTCDDLVVSELFFDCFSDEICLLEELLGSRLFGLWLFCPIGCM